MSIKTSLCLNDFERAKEPLNHDLFNNLPSFNELNLQDNAKCYSMLTVFSILSLIIQQATKSWVETAKRRYQDCINRLIIASLVLIHLDMCLNLIINIYQQTLLRGNFHQMWISNVQIASQFQMSFTVHCHFCFTFHLYLGLSKFKLCPWFHYDYKGIKGKAG